MSGIGRVAWVVGVVLAVLVPTVAPMAARAQTAPAGNAHPESHMVSEGATSNAFGESDVQAAVSTIEEKVAFAKQVDLKVLRSLAVFHDGRVKVLETLARETVYEITGRKTYRDYLKPKGADGTYNEERDGGKVQQYDYDPMFTLFDVTIEPQYYMDKALVGVGYLPLREEFLVAAFPSDTDAQERWKKVGRLSPQMLMAFGEQIELKHEAEIPFREAMNRIRLSWEVLQGTPGNFNVVAPAQTSEPWKHLSTLEESSAIRVAAKQLGEAWRKRDAAGVNAAAAGLAAELPKIHADVYPTTRRDIEMAYNRANAFEWGAWGYFFALLSLLLAFGTGRGWLKGLGATFLVLAVAMHAFGFITRCIIAERFAIQNQFESMTGLSLFATVVGVGLMLAKRQWLFAAATAGVGFLVLLAATQAAIPGREIGREAAILNTSVLLKYHVTTVLASYGLISLGFIVSVFYLGAHYFGKKSVAALGVAAVGVGEKDLGSVTDDGVLRGRERTLKDLDKAQMTVLQLAFWTLGVGILLGAWWADHSWGRWWAFDPKETWALITWIVYLIVIHVRMAQSGNRGLTTAWLSVAGFVVMLWTYFGVNLILPGLHAYA